jgi:hypothetical protein
MANPRALLNADQHRVKALLEGDLAEAFVKAPRREAGVLPGEGAVDPDYGGGGEGDREEHVGLLLEGDLDVGEWAGWADYISPMPPEYLHATRADWDALAYVPFVPTKDSCSQVASS